MDRFLLADNPMRPDQSGCFIIHMIDPISIIACHENHVDIINQPCRQYSYTNSDGILEHWTLSVHHMYTANMAALDDVNSQAMIDKLLKKAWHWYKAYMDWEDDNIDLEEYGKEN